MRLATTNVATAISECIQARRAARGQPAFASALADGVQRGIVKEYTAEAERRVREVNAMGQPRLTEAQQRLNDALQWKAWDAVK